MRDDRALAVRIAAAGALASFLDGLRHASERAPVGPILHVAHAALAMCQDNVKVKASDIPFPSTVDKVAHTENGRTSAERAFDHMVVDKQIALVRALNAFIESNLH